MNVATRIAPTPGQLALAKKLAEGGEPRGSGITHVDAAAYAALLAIDRGAPGIYNVTEPNEMVSSDKARDQLGWNADFRLSA